MSEALKDSVIPIKSTAQFAEALINWHTSRCQVVLHMLTLPDGSKFTVGDGDEPVEIILTGDVMTGFKFGIEMAMTQMGTLPFVVETEDGTEDAPVGE